MVQHRAAHFVTGKPCRVNQRDSITDILRALNWPTLQRQQATARSPVLRTHFAHNFKLVPYQPNIDLYKYSFLRRTVHEWNRLDEEVALIAFNFKAFPINIFHFN